MAVIYVMRSKLSQKRTSTIITNVCVVLYSLFLFMLKIYAFVGVFIAITRDSNLFFEVEYMLVMSFT